MSHEHEMLAETVRGLVERHASREHPPVRRDFNPGLWKELEELGFTLVSVPEEAGGAGGSLGDAAAVVRATGATAAEVPLAESALVGGWLLGQAGLTVDRQPITVAPGAGGLDLLRSGAGWTVRGSLERVPWGRFAAVVAVAVPTPEGTMAVALPSDAWTADPVDNVAGEPRDTLRVDAELPAEAVAPVPDTAGEYPVLRRGALARAVAMAGALETVLELTVRYVIEREQFGRSIGRFQAVQHMVAELAGEVAATSAAADAAVAAEERGTPGLQAVAAAKVRAGVAAGTVTTIAHQLHGAMGFTDEHELYRHTTRLWSWRDEFGSDAYWALVLGRNAARGGGDALWPAMLQAA
jgi:acyl-CoA dehydrogenase